MLERKASIGLAIVLSLLVTSTFVLSACSLDHLSAQATPASLPTYWPSVYFCNGTVCNEEFIGQIGETISIALVVSNLTDNLVPDPEDPNASRPIGNLMGFDIQLSWNTTVLQYVNHTVTAPVENYSSPVWPSPYAGVLHEPIFELKNVVNETGHIKYAANENVTAWFAYSVVGSFTVFNGNGTFFTMTFNVLTEGYSHLTIERIDLAGEGTVLPDAILFHTLDDYGVTAIPELSSIILLFFVVSLLSLIPLKRRRTH